MGEPGTPRAGGGRGESGGRERKEGREADYVLATRFAKVEESSVWKKPFKMPWQSDEEVASKPGTCEHTAAVGLDVQLTELGRSDEEILKTTKELIESEPEFQPMTEWKEDFSKRLDRR